MKAIIVDNEKPAAEITKRTACGIKGLDITNIFNDGEAALKYIGNNKIDIAIIDINIQGMSGIDLGYKIKSKMLGVEIIYITKAKAFPMDAINLRAAAYLQKPCTTESLGYAAARKFIA